MVYSKAIANRGYDVPLLLLHEHGCPPVRSIAHGPCRYDLPSNSIHMSDAVHPSVRQFVWDHEYGHYLHHKTGLLTPGYTDPSLRLLFNRLGEQKQLVDGTDFVASARKFGVNLADPLTNEQFGCYFDAVGCLTRGRHGAGHTRAYYTEANNADMELFAHGYAAVVRSNPFISMAYPELVTHIATRLRLEHQSPWYQLSAKLCQYHQRFNEPFPHRLTTSAGVHQVLDHALTHNTPLSEGQTKNFMAM